MVAVSSACPDRLVLGNGRPVSLNSQLKGLTFPLAELRPWHYFCLGSSRLIAMDATFLAAGPPPPASDIRTRSGLASVPPDQTQMQNFGSSTTASCGPVDNGGAAAMQTSYELHPRPWLDLDVVCYNSLLLLCRVRHELPRIGSNVLT